MAKDILFGKDARTRIMKGVAVLADAVGSTLGPAGRYVVIEEPQDMAPLITKDGVTVAKHIWLEDAVQNMGARMVRDVAAKTVNDCGDGTTTATVLARSIFRGGLDAVEGGFNPHGLKRGIDAAVNIVVEDLKAHALEATPERIVQVATVSSNNDPAIGKLMGEAKKLPDPTA